MLCVSICRKSTNPIDILSVSQTYYMMDFVIYYEGIHFEIEIRVAVFPLCNILQTIIFCLGNKSCKNTF